MNTRIPRVSLGMPVYNGEDYMAQAIESILAQTYTDFELIICDNASTDATEAIARRYAAADSRVRYYRNPTNLGAARNYNLTVDLARGEFFRWAAHDDMITPTWAERCVEAMDRYPEVVLVYPRAIIIDGEGQELRRDEENFNLRSPKVYDRYCRFHNLARGEINAIFGLMRTSVLRQTPLIGAYSSSDMLLLGEMALRGEFYEVPEFLFLRRDHKKSSVNANWVYSSRAVWFDPANKDKPQLTRWKWLREYADSIYRVPLSPADKVLCYTRLAQWMMRPYNAAGLTADLVLAAAWPFCKDLDARFSPLGLH